MLTPKERLHSTNEMNARDEFITGGNASQASFRIKDNFKNSNHQQNMICAGTQA